MRLHASETPRMQAMRYGQPPAFIDVDDAGLLIPVDVNFPLNTDRWWRLAQAAPLVTRRSRWC
jgi:hypothetical protein